MLRTVKAMMKIMSRAIG
jgi:hypothetical protein